MRKLGPGPAVAHSEPQATASLQSGANIVSTYFYNNRLQPCRISVKSSCTAPGQCSDAVNVGDVLDFTYGFSAGTANNGNVASIANNRNPNRSQSFTYDELNRIKTAQTLATTQPHCWGETFSYDIWASLLSAAVTKCSPPAQRRALNPTPYTLLLPALRRVPGVLILVRRRRKAKCPPAKSGWVGAT